MNKQLVGREFPLPDEVVNHINLHLSQQPTDNLGINRAKNLLGSRKVNYNQLKRILHDLRSVDKQTEQNRYNLYGGEPMERWGNSILTNERNLIQNKKDSRNKADEMGAIDGMRANSHNTTHRKKENFNTSPNAIKNDSENSSVSSLTSVGIFEEITKIKKLINY